MPGGEPKTPLDRARAAIKELAERPKQVRPGEIDAVVNQLEKAGYATSKRKVRHGSMVYVGGRQFQVNDHNPGSSHVKGYSVKEFLEAMTELGLYEED